MKFDLKTWTVWTGFFFYTTFIYSSRSLIGSYFWFSGEKTQRWRQTHLFLFPPVTTQARHSPVTTEGPNPPGTTRAPPPPPVTIQAPPTPTGKCRSKWLTNSVYDNHNYDIKQVDCVLPCVCSGSATVLFSPHNYFWTDARQRKIYLFVKFCSSAALIGRGSKPPQYN